MAMTDVEAAIFIDTNIVIRLTIASAPNHHQVKRAVNQLWDSGADIWISRQVLREYVSVLTRPQTYTQPLSLTMVADEVRALQARFHVADETSAVTNKLLELMENVQFGGKQVHDANIVATMLTYGIPRLLTLNTADFVRFADYITVLSLEDINDKEDAQE